jgi:hypothetical protein
MHMQLTKVRVTLDESQIHDTNNPTFCIAKPEEAKMI